MFDKKIVHDRYADQHIDRIHMFANAGGTALYYEAALTNQVPYEEVVAAVQRGFMALEQDGNVYFPTKYTLTNSGITFYCDGDKITIAITAPAA